MGRSGIDAGDGCGGASAEAGTGDVAEMRALRAYDGRMPYGWKNYRDDNDRRHGAEIGRLAEDRSRAASELGRLDAELYEALVEAREAGCHQGFIAEAAGLSRHQLRHILQRGRL